VHLSSRCEPGETIPFELTVDRVKRAYDQAVAEHKNVKGMIILNPGNPLGTVYSREQIMPILDFLASKQLYCIFDEIYALSTFNVSNEAKFDSVMSYWNSVPDPLRIIWLWGMSKDFGNPGVRVSFMYSTNSTFMECVNKLQPFQCVPILMHGMVEKFFLDDAWMDNVYLPTNMSLMKQNHSIAEARLRRLGIPILKTRAGFFIFADLRQYLKSQTFEEERWLFEKFFAAGVYIVPGQTLYCNEPGWFRILFTLSRETLEIGLSRIENVLSSLKADAKIADL